MPSSTSRAQARVNPDRVLRRRITEGLREADGPGTDAMLTSALLCGSIAAFRMHAIEDAASSPPSARPPRERVSCSPPGQYARAVHGSMQRTVGLEAAHSAACTYGVPHVCTDGDQPTLRLRSPRADRAKSTVSVEHRAPRAPATPSPMPDANRIQRHGEQQTSFPSSRPAQQHPMAPQPAPPHPFDRGQVRRLRTCELIGSSER